MYENGYGLWLEESGNGERYEVYSSLEKAKRAAAEEWGIDISNQKEDVSLGIGEAHGKNWFVVAPEDVFINCTVADLDNWENWYEEDWIETLYIVDAGGVSYESDHQRLSVVKADAEKWISYCQSDLTISKNHEIVAIRRWYGVAPSNEDEERDIIEIGNGFYDEWVDYFHGEPIYREN